MRRCSPPALEPPDRPKCGRIGSSNPTGVVFFWSGPGMSSRCPCQPVLRTAQSTEASGTRATLAAALLCSVPRAP
eukprot:7814419-Pyramimonas_sp.AAC.1